jgi:hypothetical protein
MTIANAATASAPAAATSVRFDIAVSSDTQRRFSPLPFRCWLLPLDDWFDRPSPRAAPGPKQGPKACSARFPGSFHRHTKVIGYAYARRNSPGIRDRVNLLCELRG